MKKISMFFAALCLSAMAMAAVKATFDFSGSDNPWSLPKDYVIGENTYTNGTQSVKINGVGYIEKGTTKGGAKFQSGKEGYGILMGKQGSYVELPAFDFEVSRIKVYGLAGASSKVTFNVFAGDSAISTEATSALVDHEFVIPVAAQAKGTIFQIKVTNPNNIQISKIEVFEVVAGAPADPKFSVAGGTYITAQNVELTCDTAGASIYYTLDGTDPTASSTLYSEAILVDKATTIKAIAIKDEVSSSVSTAEYKIIITEGDGTQDNPFTVADVKKLGNPGFKGMWVTGTIVGAYVSNKPVAGVPESTKSNMALATGTDTIPVALPSGDIQKDLNLVDNPTYLGSTIKVKGELANYFGTTGVKSTSAYDFGATAVFAPKQEGAMVKKMMMNGQVVLFKDGKYFNLLGTEL